MVTEADVRAKWVELCLSYDGCSIASEPDRFCDLVAAVDPASVRAFFSQRTKENVESSCGVVSIGLIRKLCRAFGLRVAELEQPMTPAWLDGPRRLAQRYGCEVKPGNGRMPTVGCAYYLFDAATNAMHWRNVVDGAPGQGSFTTIDGGAKDAAGFQSIAKARPQLRGYFDVLSGKSVAFWIDAVRLVMALLAAVGAAGLPGAPVTIAEETAKGAVKGAVAKNLPIEGIDVASIQGAIDWRKVAASSVRFAYVRALIGRDDRDMMAERNCAGALAAGLDVGVYGVLYPRVGKVQDADVQASQLADLHRRFGATLRPMIDVETLPGLAPSSADWLAAVRLYASSLDAAGLSPIIYTYPAFWAALKAGAEFARYPLWIANYTRAKSPTVPPPWKEALVWQYAASAPGFEGRVDGVTTLVDRNRLYGPMDALRVGGAPMAA